MPEPANNSRLGAEPIGFPGQISDATLGGGGDFQDVYVFQATTTGTTTITLDGNGDYRFALENEAGARIGSNFAKGTPLQTITFNHNAGETFYISVGTIEALSSQVQVYSLRVGSGAELSNGADLTLTQLSVEPGSIIDGQQIRVQAEVENIGTGTAGPSILTYFISDDIILDESDVVVAQSNIGSLSAGASTGLFSDTVSIRYDDVGIDTDGEYYLLASVDHTETVAETTESNNTFRAPFTATGLSSGNPDLVARNFAISQTDLRPGLTIDFSWDVINVGTSTAGPSVTELAVFDLGTLETLFVIETLSPSNAIAPGASVGQSFSFVVPTIVTAGTYGVDVLVDSTGAVAESNEDNNYSDTFAEITLSPIEWNTRAKIAAGSAPADMSQIRDFDGNSFGATGDWKLIGQVDIQFDGDAEFIFVNSVLGRWATVGPDANGSINFGDHSQGGETRVVGIYIDPEVEKGNVIRGSDFDSQQRFQNDLRIDNLTVVDAFDFDGDGFQEIYFKVNDGTAFLRALMHADGNIQYANYQNEDQVRDYILGQGFDQSVVDTIL